jgi:hypothetical protein
MTLSSASVLAKQRRPIKFDWEFWLVGIFSFLLFVAVSYYLVFRLNVFVTDAMARTRSAWQVFFSSEPKLSNVGFVWAPLPTIMQLPLVLIPALRVNGFSANIVTAFSGAACVQVIFLFLRKTKIRPWIRYLVLLAYIANPMVLYYSCNGMSEIVLELFVLITAFAYLRWEETHKWVYLTTSSIATCLAFLSRYDGSFVAVVVVIMIGIDAIMHNRKQLSYAESVILLYATPIAYVAGLWLFLNWLIMGDPLYFVRSDYSNAGQIGYQLAQRVDLLPLKNNLLAAMYTGLKETYQIFPFFILVSILLLIFAIIQKKKVWVGVIAISWSLILFTISNIFMGQSAMFIRYFISAIPMGIVLLAGLLELLPVRWRGVVALLSVVGIGLSAFSTADLMSRHDEWGQSNDTVVKSALTDTPLHNWDEEQALAKFINTKTTGYVLMDDFQGYRVIFFSGKPWRFITPGNTSFKKFLKSPYGNVAYILTSSTSLEGELNQVNNTYPYLFTEGADWAKLVYEDSTWKLFEVESQPGNIILNETAN